MVLNETPVRTSKIFGINHIEIKDLKIPDNVQEFNGFTLSGDVSEFKIDEDVNKDNLKFGISKELENQVYENANKNIKIVVDNSKEKKIYLDFNFNIENLNLIENIEIIANENSKATIIIKYISDDQADYYHNGILKIKAKEQSNIDVIIINMLNNKSNNFLNMENQLEEKSKLNYTVIDLGGKNNVSNYFSNLIGNYSESKINTIYLGKQNQVFDMNYIVELNGEKTDANIEVQGALMDQAKKHFKGTIDFRKGCKKAKGNENEYCMLLSENARSKALPMLICTEEDVEGNHSSAAGKIQKEILFYIMSRGFSYKEAMKLIVKAKFNDIIDNINSEEIKEMVLEEIDKILD